MTTTGKRLKELREKRGWSQADVAKRIGVGRTTYLKYETGENRPVRKIHELSELYGVSYDYLLANEGIKKDKEIHLADDETFLVTSYRWLDTEGKNLILSMIKRLRGEITPKASKTSIIQNNKTGNNYGVVGGNFNASVTIG